MSSLFLNVALPMESTPTLKHEHLSRSGFATFEIKRAKLFTAAFNQQAVHTRRIYARDRRPLSGSGSKNCQGHLSTELTRVAPSKMA